MTPETNAGNKRRTRPFDWEKVLNVDKIDKDEWPEGRGPYFAHPLGKPCAVCSRAVQALIEKQAL